MRNRVFSVAIFVLLLASMSILAFNIQPVRAQGTIYIRVDGSVDPPDAPISTFDNITYTFTGNINDSIVIERNNIVLNGAGYTVAGSGSGSGIALTGRSNVTIRNMTIRNFDRGIELGYPSNNNVLSGNNVTANSGDGIHLVSSSYNTLSGNNITNNENGISVVYSSDNNVLSGNNIVNNDFGISLLSSSDNVLSGNVMKGNGHNFGVLGSALSHYLQSVDTSNLVDGKPVYYFVNQSDMVVNADAYPMVGYLGFVNCSNVTVQRLNLTSNNQGLLFEFTNDSRITGNNFANNGYGIWLDASFNNVLSGNNFANNHYGIFLGSSSDNALSGNNVTANNHYGIYLLSSSDNVLSGNNVSANNEYGIQLSSSSNNTLFGNNVVANQWCGIYLDSSSDNALSGNYVTANNADGIYLDSSSDNALSGNDITANNEDGIVLHSSSSNALSGNDITANNRYGIWLWSSSDNALSRNNVANNVYGGIRLLSSSDNNTLSGNDVTASIGYGIWLYSSSDNTLSGNDVTANNDYGIGLQYNSSYNSIFHNSFVNNARQVYTEDSNNIWDDGYPSGGNYWSDYNGTDADHDGIGDIPYVIDANNTDHYPLMAPYVIPEFSTFLILPLFMIAALLAAVVCRRRHFYSPGR